MKLCFFGGIRGTSKYEWEINDYRAGMSTSFTATFDANGICIDEKQGAMNIDM